jgi:hypothetical protein
VAIGDIELRASVNAANGQDRLKLFDVIETEDGGANFHSIVWEKLAGGEWRKHVELTSDDFQWQHPNRRWISRIAALLPDKSLAAVQVGEGNKPMYPLVIGQATTFYYSWRLWDLSTNREARRLRDCDSSFEPCPPIYDRWQLTIRCSGPANVSGRTVRAVALLRGPVRNGHRARRWAKSLASMETFVLYTSMKGPDANSGATVQIKVGPLKSAQLGFASEALANEFLARSDMPKDTVAIRVSQLGQRGFVDAAKSEVLLRFPDQRAVELYFADRESFPYKKYLVPGGCRHAG